jgi:hypothetical protein
VHWISLRFLLISLRLQGLEPKTLDIILSFPQADLNVPLYMEISVDVSVDGIHKKRKYILLLGKSLWVKTHIKNW